MTMRVVLHAPTAGALFRARSNIRNLIAAEGGVEVRIIANADAVEAAIGAPDSDTDRFLYLCENTLRNRSLLAPADLPTVTAAVHELARLQAEGWAYIRA